jgi:hypothetical protein
MKKLKIIVTLVYYEKTRREKRKKWEWFIKSEILKQLNAF